MRLRILLPLAVHGHVAAGEDLDPPDALPGGPNSRRRRPGAGRRLAGRRQFVRRGDELGLFHVGLPQGIGRFRILPVHAALVDGRQHVGLARHPAGADLHVADRVEVAEPFLVVDVHRLAFADQVDPHVAFEIGDYLRTLVRAGRGMVDPEHGFLADGRLVALHQVAVAPQQPHFIGPLLPAIGSLGRDGNRLDVIALRHRNLAKSVAGSRQKGMPERPRDNLDTYRDSLVQAHATRPAGARRSWSASIFRPVVSAD